MKYLFRLQESFLSFIFWEISPFNTYYAVFIGKLITTMGAEKKKKKAVLLIANTAEAIATAVLCSQHFMCSNSLNHGSSEWGR